MNALARLTKVLEERAALESERMVAENIRACRKEGLLSVGVPEVFGGGGAAYPALCDMIRRLAGHCGSTGLVLAMHTHQVAILARRAGASAQAAALLRRVAGEGLMLVSSGGTDWLDSSGTATPTAGGYIVSARKCFASGAAMGDLLMTSAVVAGDEGDKVIHFSVPLDHPSVAVVPSWSVLGMRGTGSHDIMLRSLFVSEEEILATRRRGRWALPNHLTALLAIPLICSAYYGVAEALFGRVVESLRAGRLTPDRITQLGELATLAHAARLAWVDMVATGAAEEPGFPATNRVMMNRRLLDQHLRGLADLALDTAGGRSFYVRNGLERLFRDLQAMRFHPMKQHDQELLAGCLALGPHYTDICAQRHD